MLGVSRRLGRLGALIIVGLGACGSAAAQNAARAPEEAGAGAASTAGSLQPAEPVCSENLSPLTAGAAFRSPPNLAPSQSGAGRVLDLGITAMRSDAQSGDVAIGDLAVGGTPEFVLSPRIFDPAGTSACLGSARLAYRGSVWTLRQGDVLRMHLDSKLDFARGEISPPRGGAISCRGANIHTHGLLVSPYKRTEADGHAVYGDYVLDVAVPAAGAEGDPCGEVGGGPLGLSMSPSMSHAMHHASTGVMDYETRIPGTPGRSGRGPGQHPSGFFWFHPHSHGYKGPLFAGATTGAISIGDLADYACAPGAGGGCAPDQNVTLRYLILKDAEVAPRDKSWRLLYARDRSLEDVCASGGVRGAERPGECSDWRGRRWLFTVNGLRDPSITDVAPGKLEVWRIANASADVTYRLSLLPVADVNGPALPFTILSLAGAAPEPNGWARPERSTELLLMPGSRAEIAIAPPSSGGDYAFTQLGFASGGDVWPAVRLARISFPAGAGEAPKEFDLHGQPSAFPSDRFYVPGDDPACGFERDAIRRIYFVQRPSFADDRRRQPLYGVVAAVEKPGQAPVMYDASGRATPLTPAAWRALLDSDSAAPAFMHNPFGAVCTYLGHTETWIIENDTDEDHDFHIHQSEFQLDLAHRADPGYFSPDPPGSGDKLLESSDAAVAAADGRGREAAEAIEYHDTIPVPRGVSLGGRGCDGSPMNPNCRPGRVAIVIRFFRDEQVGTFVYHCHITQHEDGGMMGVVEVRCPPDDAKCRASHPQ